MELRFSQKSITATMIHWQKECCSFETYDILISMNNAETSRKHISVYYKMIIKGYWVLRNYSYHAHALQKLHRISIIQNCYLPGENARKLARRLPFASLTIPIYVAQSTVLLGSYDNLTEVT